MYRLVVQMDRSCFHLTRLCLHLEGDRLLRLYFSIMKIKPGQPYKIAQNVAKRYAAHYNIQSERCLIVPLKFFGNDASCDIRWEDENGELFLLQNKFFVCDNLVSLNQMLESKLYELWEHYYKAEIKTSTPGVTGL